MKRFHLSLLAALLLTPFFVSCTVVPDTGRRQLNMLSPAEEAQLGYRAFNQIKEQRRGLYSGNLYHRVNRIGRRIASVVDVPHARWEFVVFDDPTPNAFALPGGKVGVNTGIMPVALNDGGLATVISHEIAHVVARHSAESLSQKKLSSLGLGVLGAVIGDTSGMVGNALGIGSQLTHLKFSRNHELEADQLGALYMARAGYDPRESVYLWRRFADYKRRHGQGGRGSLLSTHPLDDRRIRELEAFMPRALQEYQR